MVGGATRIANMRWKFSKTQKNRPQSCEKYFVCLLCLLVSFDVKSPSSTCLEDKTTSALHSTLETSYHPVYRLQTDFLQNEPTQQSTLRYNEGNKSFICKIIIDAFN